MKLCKQTPKPDRGFQPSPDASTKKGLLSAARKLSAPWRLLLLLAGLALLGLATPSALADLKDQSPPGCTGSTLGINLFTDAADVHVGDTLHYSVTIFNNQPGTPRVGCDATSIQAWVVTPDGKTNIVTLTRTTLLDQQFDYYTNAATYVVRAQDILPDGTVRATANDTGIIHQNVVNSTGGGFQGVNTQVSQPCIKLLVSCLGSIGENGIINFTGTVTNCGNDTLVGVTVTNFDNNGFFSVNFVTNLLKGQIATFTGSWVPLNPCGPNTVTLVAEGVDQFTTYPKTVTSSGTVSCANTLTPGILVTKACPAAPVAPGQLLVFSGSVSNSGNITLTNIVVVDNQPAADTPVFTLASLAPGAVATFTGSYVAPAVCSISDTLTASAASVCGVPVTNSASANCSILTSPQILVTTACPATPVAPGGVVTYTGTVRNTGDVALANVIVVSDHPAANTTVFTVATLAPGASANFTGSYTVPANACSVTATIKATGTSLCGAAVSNTSLSTCTVTTAPAIAVTLACPTVSAATGGSITYTGTVRNSGTVTLNNVSVVNSQPAPNTVVFTVPSLAPGASANFTATFTAPSDSCSVSTTVTATGNDNCSSAPVSNSASATCTLVTTPGIVVSQLCPTTTTLPGAPMTYTGTVNNSGNITLTNIVVLNNLSGSSPVFTAATLAPGATVSFTGSYTAPTNCVSTSTSTATAESICGVTVKNSATTTCSVQTAPAITVTQTCPTTAAVPGGLLTSSGTVRNTGNITLTNVVVVSSLPVANTTVFTVATLAPGASANFTSSYTVPTNLCSVTANLVATGKETCGGTAIVGTFVSTCPVTTAPAISVTLACPAVSVATGGSITYTGTVRNSGNVTLNNISVANNQPAPNTVVFTQLSLAPGASAVFTATFTTPANSCSVSTTVTASGNDNCSNALVSNSASATCTLITTPAILITQLCPTNLAVPGGAMTFSGTVSNPGNITLTNVVVLNNLSGPAPIFTAATLAPGATVTFTGSYLAPTNCSTTSTSIAIGESICGVSVTNSVTTTCAVLTSPAIQVTQTCPAAPVVQGGILTYSGTVLNIGNTILTNIQVFNNRSGTTPVFTLGALAPGASANFSGSYVTLTNCCVDSSTVTASGQGCGGAKVTDTATRTCVMLTSPAITVTKVCAPGLLQPGDLLTYSGTVSNSGNITLIGVVIVNNQPTNNSPVLGPIDLVPGQSVSYTASYIIPSDFCGSDTVTATGSDVCTSLQVSKSVTTTCPVVTTPGLSVIKNCPATPTPRGGLYIYTGMVTNTGNVTLVNVIVVNDQPTNNTPVFGPITLAPGASANFTNSYIAPLCCCEIIDTITATGQDRCDSTNVSATASQVCPLLTTPALTITEVCPATPVPLGGLFVFSGSISNSGDVVLTNVYVFGPQPGTGTPVLGPMELAPGETETFSGSSVLTSVTNTVTATGTDTCQARTVTARANCSGPLQAVQPVIGGPGVPAIRFSNGSFGLSFATEAGMTYNVQFKNSLSDPTWTTLPNMPAIGTGGPLTITDSAGGPPIRYYRVTLAQ